MNYPKTPEYRFDLSGVHPDNFISEERIIVDPEFPIIAFKHSPFYMESVSLTNAQGKPLDIDVDFKFFKIDKELTNYTGKEVGSLIQIINPVKTTIYATYRTVGSVPLFNETLKNIYDSIATREDSVYWGDITNKPTLFTPKLHFHDVTYNLYGFKDLADAVGALLDWAVPEITYNRDNMPKFRPYDLATVEGNFVKADLGTKPLSRVLMQVKSDYNALTYPAPHLDFFIQVVKNATRFINNYVKIYTDQLNEHIKAMNDPHGLNKDQLGLGLRDNFKVNTLADAPLTAPFSDKRLVTPAWFAALSGTIKGRTDNYVEKGSLPISRFGDNSFIPPLMDAPINGLGSRHGIAVACLERGGWISALVNAKDLGNDKLVYLKIMKDASGKYPTDEFGGVIAQSRFKYAPTDALLTGINLNAVVRGGDYRWMVVGDTKANKWFLVKTNGTLDYTKHDFYPLTFPAAFNDGNFKYRYMSMAVVDGPNAVGKFIHFYHRNTTLDTNSRLRSTLMRLDISAVSKTGNEVKLFNLPSVSAAGVVTTPGNGFWEPFPLTQDANGKVTEWFTKFNPAVDQAKTNLHCVHHYYYDTNGEDFYLRINFTPVITKDNVDIKFPCSVVHKYTKQANGSYTRTVIKGSNAAVFNATSWDKSKGPSYAEHLGDSANLNFMNEFLDYWPGNGLSAGDSVSNSKLIDGSWFSYGAEHRLFYPSVFTILPKSDLNLDDLNVFSKGYSAQTRTGSEVEAFYINNIGPTGISTGLSNPSVVGDLITKPTVEYEIARTLVGNGRFKHIARKLSGKKTVSRADDRGVSWLMSSPSTELKTLDIPEHCRYVHWVDDNNSDNSGRALFSVISGNTTGVTEDAGPRTLTFKFGLDLTTDSNKVIVKEEMRIKFTQACVKQLLGKLNAAAVYDGEQFNWNIYWFPYNGAVIQPMIVGYWIDTTKTPHAMMCSAAVILQVGDPSDESKYKVAADGVKELTYDAADVNVVGDVVTVKVADLPDHVDNSYWISEPPKHTRPGSTYVYNNTAGEVSLYGCSTVHLAMTKEKKHSEAIVPSFGILMGGLRVIKTIAMTGIYLEQTPGETTAYKGIGILSNFNMDVEDYLGGSVVPGKLTGKSFLEWQTNYLKGNDGSGLYYLTDLSLTNGFSVYLASESLIIFDGGSYTLTPKKIDLTLVKPNPANTTFYLYLEMPNDVPEITAKLSPVTETSRSVYLGTVVTDSTKVSSIKVSPVFTLNGFRISEVQQGASIPASSGDVNTVGVFNWGTP